MTCWRHNPEEEAKWKPEVLIGNIQKHVVTGKYMWGEGKDVIWRQKEKDRYFSGSGWREGQHPDEEHQVINGGGKLAGTSETNEVINKEGKTTRAGRAKLENTGKKAQNQIWQLN